MSNNNTPPVVLRLWNSGYQTNGQSIYLGTINEVHPSHHKFLPQLRYKRWEDFTDGLDALQNNLEAHFKALKSDHSQRAERLHWNRDILLVE